MLIIDQVAQPGLNTATFQDLARALELITLYNVISVELGE
jgi:hypothetical protein